MVRNFDLKKGSKGVVDLRTKGSRKPKVRRVVKSRPVRKEAEKKVQPAKPKTQESKPASTFLRSSTSSYPKMKRLPKKGKKSVLTFLIIILILLISAAIAGFVFFGSKGNSEDSIKVSLATSKSIASGEELSLELTYENIDQIALGEIEVIFEYPKSFFFERSNLKPIGSEQNIWRLPNLEPGQSGKIEIDGQLIGTLNEHKEFKVTFYYKPLNFNSTFKTELLTDVKINDVLFEVTVQAPEELAKGTDTEFKAEFKNTTAMTMENMQMAFMLGDSFVVSGANPSTTSDLVWQYDKILPHSHDKVVLNGSYKEDVVGEIPWEYSVWQIITKDEKQEERLFFKATGTVKIVAPDVKVSLEFINPDSATWGEDLKCQIIVENSGQAKVENLQVKVNFNSSVIDWSKFENSSSAQITDDALAWFKDNGDFGKKVQELKDGASEKLVFNLPIIQEPADLDFLSPEELLVEARASLMFDFNNKQQLVDSEAKIALLAIQPQLISEARYNLDASTVVGEGPMPPAIGQETQYRIYLKIYSGSRGLSNVAIKTTLPAYINWAGVKDETSVGTSLTYDESTRQVTWNMDSLSANTQVMASFNVSVTPNQTQVNQLLILTNPVSLSAKEQETNNLVSKTTNLLTSDLIDDSVNQGKGRVTVGQ